MSLFHRTVFELIYFSRLWGKGSGRGSTAAYTKAYRKFLAEFIAQNKIKSIVDLGCGDWESTRLLRLRAVNYVGIDVVRSVIKNNIQNYQKENVKFLCRDIVKDPLPRADLAIIKDVLQHWPSKTISDFLPKLKQYKYVLVVNDFRNKRFKRKVNKEIYCVGSLRPLDLRKPPFNVTAKEIFSFNEKKVILLEH